MSRLATALLAAALLAPLPAAAAPPAVLIDLEWRGMALAQHFSHGPGVGVAVGLADDRVRVGLHGFARPGPLNPATFSLQPEAPYKGQRSVALRSDGGLMGPSLSVGGSISDRLRLDVGVMAGYGGFGFYLVDEDRKTPDGRKPSAWEDELMDGRDSSLGIGVEGGPRLSWTAHPHLRPYVQARYTTILGYDAFLADRYAGFSLALGVSTGRF